MSKRYSKKTEHVHATTWMDLREVVLNNMSDNIRMYPAWFHLYDILKMTEFH